MGYHLAGVELAPSLRGSIDILDIQPLRLFQQFHVVLKCEPPTQNMAYRTSAIRLPKPDPFVAIPTAFHAHAVWALFVANPTIGALARARPDRLRPRLRLDRAGPHGDTEHQPPQQEKKKKKSSRCDNPKTQPRLRYRGFFPVPARRDVIVDARQDAKLPSDPGPPRKMTK